MAQLVVYAQQDHKIILNDNTNKVQLDQASIIQLAVGRDDVDSMVRSGNKLIITLKNGEKIVIDHYFTDIPDENQLVLSRGNSEYYEVNFDSKGQFQSYTDLVTPSSIESFPQLSTPQAAPVAEESTFSKSTLLKLGLGVLAAEGIYLAAFDDNKSSNKSSSAPDIVAPSLKSATLNTDGDTVTGAASEAGCIVYAVDTDGKVLGTATADASGNYSVKLSEPLTDGNQGLIYVQDSAGNKSQPSLLQGSKDTIAPEAPVAQVSADGTAVSGTAESGSTITITDANGNVLGTGVATNGTYVINLKTPLESGQVVKVTAKDKAGNVSEASEAELGKDTTPPTKPLVEVNEEGTKLIGTAEANATVQILDSEGKVIATGTVDANGQFSIDLPTALTDKISNQVIIVDAAGNKSTAVTIKAGTDTIAPEKAADLKINADGNEVTGTAEPNATVTIKDSSSKVIGSATADADGKFTVTLSTAVTDGKYCYITVADKSGNVSDSNSIQGNKDTIAPTVPKVPTVTDDVGAEKGTIENGGTTDDARPTFKGTGAEAGTILSIFDKGNNLIAQVTVDTDKTWTWTPSSDLALGEHNFTFVLTDASGNTSPESDVLKITIVAPQPETPPDETVPETESVPDTTDTDLVEPASIEPTLAKIVPLSLLEIATDQASEPDAENTLIYQDGTINTELLLENTTSGDLAIEQMIADNSSNSSSQTNNETAIQQSQIEAQVLTRSDLDQLIQSQQALF